ncbi:ATP-binding protein [Nocardioides sp. J2M5]|uniref:ATP-binding protein n=1 Tax=Nocardioides palaemonis TaxID=2829810 RepID=UPI001BAE3E4E|nr:ATP-binding protein [Nocardioides palaemonis]MBS2936433.1 ATP-binding protein [Nocardioides palaemonis]
MAGDDVTHAVIVEAMGVPVGIRAEGDVAERLRQQWSRALTDRTPEAVVDLEGLETLDAADHDYAVTTRVTLAALQATAGRRVNVHAGALADDAGRVLAFVGPSGAGKTTAVSRLARDLGYLSDETVSLDHRLVVHAHAKPLSVVLDPAAPRRKDSVSPDDLGLRVGAAGSRLHRIVLLHRGDDDSGLAPVPASRAIAEIVDQTSSLVHLDHPMRRLAAAVEECGGVWGLNYREFERWADEVAALLDHEPQPAEPWIHHPGGPTAVPDAPGAWSRVPWRDAVEYAEELVVMVDDQVRVLAGLGPLLWLALERPRTPAELAAHVQEEWGEHPDADALVADALAVLAEQGLVRPPA